MKLKFFLKFLFLLLFVVLSLSTSGMAQTEYLRHPAGLEFKYPNEWTINEATFADLELVPPDQNVSASGPTEAYFVWGLGLDAAKSQEEQIANQLKELMEGIASFLKPVGDPEAFLGKRVQGLVYTYEGKRPDGFEVRSRVFVLPEKDVAFALVALGLRENIVKREASVSEMFGTFLQKNVTVDSKLTGLWITPETGIPPVQSQNSSAPERNEMQLEADGSFVTLMQSPYDKALVNTLNSGKWYAKGNRLYFISAGNVGLMFRYELEGQPGSRKLTLVHSNGDKQEFQEFQSDSE
jgi:hypothetical protein